MEEDALKRLEATVHQLQQELTATQCRLMQVQQELQRLQGVPQTSSTNFFKSPSRSFSLENFIGLRLIHLVGIVVLVIGLSIGVKYAIDKQLISEHARIGLAYGAGLLLYLLSWRLQKKYAAFSAILFSGAMASLYFTTYGAFVYYHLFPFAAAFVVMIVLTFFTAYQALRYNRQEIAILGLVGAYGIPFLISSNSGRAALLFLYVGFINAAVVYLSLKRNWRTVAVLAQIITWMLLLGWAVTRFTPAQQNTAYAFGAFFFLLFSAHALALKLSGQQPLQQTQAQQLLSNNVLLYVLLVMVHQASNLKADYSVLHAGFSFFVAVQVAPAYMFLRNEIYLKRGLALFALILFLLFIAARWEGITVTLLWLLLAVVLFAAGFGLKSVWLRLSAVVLMGITLVKLVLLDSLRFSTVQKIIAYLTLGVLLLVVGFLYQRFKEKLFGRETPES